eukprot:241934_1
MADTAALKTRIISLWGIDSNTINSKLDALRVFLIDIPETILLDLLLKSDLDIERAINLHFSNHAPTPIPPLQINPPPQIKPSASSSIEPLIHAHLFNDSDDPNNIKSIQNKQHLSQNSQHLSQNSQHLSQNSHHVLLNSIQLKRLQNTIFMNKYTNFTKCIENVDTQTLLNDYLYVIHHHSGNADFEYICNILGGYCDQTECNIFKRYYHPNTSSSTMLNKFDFAKLRIMDKIHCCFRHSSTIDARFIFNQNHSNNSRMRFIQNNKLLQIKKRLVMESKQHTISNRLYTRYNQLHFDDEKSINCKHYSYGKEFKYDFVGEHIANAADAIIVLPKYSTLKQELTQNNISVIPRIQFDIEYAQAQIYFMSQYIAETYPPFGLRPKISMQLHWLLSLMVYCNFDSLQYHFSKTYRENITQHCNFYHR